MLHTVLNNYLFMEEVVSSNIGHAAYARQEFNLCGLDLDDSFNSDLRSCVLDILSLVDSFDQKHGDLGILFTYLERARSRRPFSPLTFEDSMWFEYAPGRFQHIRYSGCFRDRSFSFFRPYVINAFTCRLCRIRSSDSLVIESHPNHSSGWSCGSVWLSENGVLTGQGFSGNRCLLKADSVQDGWYVPAVPLSLDVTEVFIDLDSSVFVVETTSPDFLSLNSSYDLCWYFDERLVGVPVSSLSFEPSCNPF